MTTHPPTRIEEMERLIDRWELVGNKQREIASAEKDIGLRSAFIATSNAWMTAASDLRKYLTEKPQ